MSWIFLQQKKQKNFKIKKFPKLKKFFKIKKKKISTLSAFVGSEATVIIILWKIKINF